MSFGRLPVRVPPAVELAARAGLQLRQRWAPSPRGSHAAAERPLGPPVSPRELAAALNSLGIHAGGVLMVHSDTGDVERMGWTPSDLIDFLLEYLGPQGTLAMPSHPRLVRSGDHEVYDLRRSPSTVGLITELFRRRRGVLRSACPGSAAAALGPQARELTESHARSWAPHDEHSPYSKLADLGGNCLCIGCALDRMTLLHVAEDVMRDELGIPGFHQQSKHLVRDGIEEREVTVYGRARWLWWYLALGAWTFDMYRTGNAREVRVGDVALRVADAHRTVAWMKSEVRAGRSIYPLARANRWLRLGNPFQHPKHA